MRLYFNETSNSSNLDNILSYANISDEQRDQIDALANKYDSGNGKGYKFTPEAIRLMQKDMASVLNISLESTKEFMMKYLGFHENDFNYNIPKSNTKNNDNAYIKIGKAIANYYEEIIYGSDVIHIQCVDRNNTKAMYKEIIDALNSIE